MKRTKRPEVKEDESTVSPPIGKLQEYGEHHARHPQQLDNSSTGNAGCGDLKSSEHDRQTHFNPDKQ